MKSTMFEPRRATIGSCGYDLYSPREYDLVPGVWTVIDTGVSLEDTDEVSFKGYKPVLGYGLSLIEIKTCRASNWFMMVVPRSGLSFHYGLRIRNTVGIIDKDYRDTIKCSVTVDEPYTLEVGERFAQGIILPFGVFDNEIKPTENRKGGFGSTGKV